MAYYDKKIVYLSYMSNGSKVKNAGFVRAECRGRDYTLDMRVNGIQEWMEKQYDILAVTPSGKEHAVGRIFLQKGAGQWQAGPLKSVSAGNTLSYEEIQSLRIDLTDGKTIEGVFRKADPGRTDIRSESNSEKGEKQGLGKIIWRESEKKEKLGTEKTVWYQPERKEKQGGEKVTWFDLDKKAKQNIEKIVRVEPEKDIKSEPDEVLSEEKEEPQPELKAGSMEDSEPIHMDSAILNDKWQQLMQVYPVVHPYEDDREYVTIEPKDFVIMSGDYQHLANNSFLLHGFYNYRHIILGKEKDTTNPAGSFYLGVPGVYYEREKMVALMFGFEAFECRGGKAEPGKFGYYLRKVKI